MDRVDTVLCRPGCRQPVIPAEGGCQDKGRAAWEGTQGGEFGPDTSTLKPEVQLQTKSGEKCVPDNEKLNLLIFRAH